MDDTLLCLQSVVCYTFADGEGAENCRVKGDIYFTAVGIIDIPDEKEILDIVNKMQDKSQMYKIG